MVACLTVLTFGFGSDLPFVAVKVMYNETKYITYNHNNCKNWNNHKINTKIGMKNDNIDGDNTNNNNGNGKRNNIRRILSNIKNTKINNYIC